MSIVARKQTINNTEEAQGKVCAEIRHKHEFLFYWLPVEAGSCVTIHKNKSGLQASNTQIQTRAAPGSCMTIKQHIKNGVTL